MVLTENIDMASWFGLRGNVKGAAVWPQVSTMSSVRHASRGKVKYRPRGTAPHAKQEPLAGAPAAMTKEYGATWHARTVAAKRTKISRDRNKAACFGATIAGLVAVGLFGSAVLDQRQVASNQVTGLSAQTSVVGLSQTSFNDLAFARPANLDGPPQMQTGPLNSATAQDEQSPRSPEQLTSLPPQPVFMDHAPLGLASPSEATRPNIPNRTYAALGIVSPVVVKAPPLPQAFKCTSCDPAFPQFGQVVFDVQSADITAANVQNLMTSLASYQNTVRQSPIEIATSQVRFYRASEAQAAASLASIYNAELVDLTWFAPAADVAKIDVILANPSADPAPEDGQ